MEKNTKRIVIVLILIIVAGIIYWQYKKKKSLTFLCKDIPHNQVCVTGGIAYEFIDGAWVSITGGKSKDIGDNPKNGNTELPDNSGIG